MGIETMNISHSKLEQSYECSVLKDLPWVSVFAMLWEWLLPCSVERDCKTCVCLRKNMLVICMSVFLLWIFNMKYMLMYTYRLLNEHYIWAEVEPMSVEWLLWTEPLLGCILAVLLVKWLFLVFNIKHVEVQKLHSIAQLSKFEGAC